MVIKEKAGPALTDPAQATQTSKESSVTKSNIKPYAATWEDLAAVFLVTFAAGYVLAAVVSGVMA